MNAIDENPNDYSDSHKFVGSDGNKNKTNIRSEYAFKILNMHYDRYINTRFTYIIVLYNNFTGRVENEPDSRNVLGKHCAQNGKP